MKLIRLFAAGLYVFAATVIDGNVSKTRSLLAPKVPKGFTEFYRRGGFVPFVGESRSFKNDFVFLGLKKHPERFYSEDCNGMLLTTKHKRGQFAGDTSFLRVLMSFALAKFDTCYHSEFTRLDKMQAGDKVGLAFRDPQTSLIMQVEKLPTEADLKKWGAWTDATGNTWKHDERLGSIYKEALYKAPEKPRRVELLGKTWYVDEEKDLLYRYTKRDKDKK